MIKRDLYLKRIRPFMNKDLVKVITGIRRCGKSVMLEIIQDELAKEGVPAESMLAYNFESMTLSHLCTAEALHHDVMAKAVEAGRNGAQTFHASSVADEEEDEL